MEVDGKHGPEEVQKRDERNRSGKEQRWKYKKEAGGLLRVQYSRDDVEREHKQQMEIEGLVFTHFQTNSREDAHSLDL